MSSVAPALRMWLITAPFSPMKAPTCSLGRSTLRWYSDDRGGGGGRESSSLLSEDASTSPSSFPARMFVTRSAPPPAAVRVKRGYSPSTSCTTDP
ncbi:hypothetical protein T484DRAFT_1987178 [Baffinella frigidus]|nr:hypothetical protein T484DRAFT_1987178 [Cryptophyta sp. CCMP2293]